MKQSNRWLVGASLVAALSIAGCGGDDNDSPVVVAPPPSSGAGSVPDSAGASVAAFLDFIQSLASSDTAEPLTIGDGFVTPTDDTGDPRPLS